MTERRTFHPPRPADELELGIARYTENKWRAVTSDAFATEVTVVPIKGAKMRRWEAEASRLGEDWVGVISGGALYALDEPSLTNTNGRQVCAVVYPSVHSRLVTWWLFHVWRFEDLLRGALNSMNEGNLTVGALSSRGLLEQAAVLRAETKKLSEAWFQLKQVAPEEDPNDHAWSVYNKLSPMLAGITLASKASGGKAQSRR